MKHVHSTLCALAIVLAATIFSGGHEAAAQSAPAIPPALTTPDRVESPIGPLEFRDGVPNKVTADKIYNNLDFTYAYRAFMDNMRGVSIQALRKGMQSIGVKENEVLIFSELMDAKSLFLTANADTIYVMGVLDLTKGPMVIETPPTFLGAVQDAWFRWVIDLGAARPRPRRRRQVPDRAARLRRPAAGRRVLRRARADQQHRVVRPLVPGEQNDPEAGGRKDPEVHARSTPTNRAARHAHCRIPRLAKPSSGALTPPPSTVFHEGSGKVMNTLPPNDWSFYEMLNEVVQHEPATSLDPELMGPIAAIGIVKGKPFAPDARMKKIMTEALAVANATSRSLFMSPRDPSWYYYPNSAWFNFLFVTGYEFETPIPMVTPEGVKPFPATGYRTMDARTSFFYGVTGITPAMAMRLPGIGSQYLLAMLDADKNHFDGAKTYKVTLPKGIPAGELLVVHCLRQHDPLDARHATALSARRQPELSVARRRGRGRRFDDGLFQPDPAGRREARQLDSNRSQKGLVRDPAPLQPHRTVFH